jgi:predicted nucleic acid-binding protein
MEWVFDASITMAWCFENERIDYTDDLLRRLASSPAVVPQLWPLEVGNVLLLGVRRNRITEAKKSQFLSVLQKARIYIDAHTAGNALGQILATAEEHSLTTYDASYLELAMRLGLPLATLDTQLQTTARKVGVALL